MALTRRPDEKDDLYQPDSGEDDYESQFAAIPPDTESATPEPVGEPEVMPTGAEPPIPDNLSAAPPDPSLGDPNIYPEQDQSGEGVASEEDGTTTPEPPGTTTGYVAPWKASGQYGGVGQPASPWNPTIVTQDQVDTMDSMYAGIPGSRELVEQFTGANGDVTPDQWRQIMDYARQQNTEAMRASANIDPENDLYAQMGMGNETMPDGSVPYQVQQDPDAWVQTGPGTWMPAGWENVPATDGQGEGGLGGDVGPITNTDGTASTGETGTTEDELKAEVERLRTEDGSSTSTGATGSSYEDFLEQTARENITNPSRWDSDLVKQGMDVIESSLARLRDTGRRGLDEHYASRGLTGSSLEGFGVGDFESELQRLGSEQAFDLSREMANTYGSDRSSAMSAGLGLGGLKESARGTDLNEAFRRWSAETGYGLQERGLDEGERLNRMNILLQYAQAFPESVDWIQNELSGMMNGEGYADASGVEPLGSEEEVLKKLRELGYDV